MLIDVLKKDRIQAMKDKETAKKDLLGVLIGDATKEAKQPEDAKVVAMVKKFIKNSEETLAVCVRVGNSIGETAARAEINILEAYLPKQLTIEGLRTAVKYAVEFNNATDMGSVMKYLKDNHEGRYDGKLASQMAKEILNG